MSEDSLLVCSVCTVVYDPEEGGKRENTNGWGMCAECAEIYWPEEAEAK